MNADGFVQLTPNDPQTLIIGDEETVERCAVERNIPMAQLRPNVERHFP